MLRKSLWLPNQQPNFPVEVDCSDPLTRGMRGAFTSQGFMRDEFNAVQAASDNSTQKRTLSGAQRDYASLQRTTFPNRADYGLSSASTVVVIADVDTLTDYGALISCQNTTTTNGWELRLGNTATDSRIISHRANTSEKQFAASAGNLIAAGSRRNFISVSYPNSSVESVPTFNVNGVSYTGSATVGSATGPFTASTAQLAIGARLGGTTSLDGAVLFAGLWSRVLSFSELESIRLNPWKIFRPKSSRALVAVSGGGATFTVSARRALLASGGASKNATAELAARTLARSSADASKSALTVASALALLRALSVAGPAVTGFSVNARRQILASSGAAKNTTVTVSTFDVLTGNAAAAKSVQTFINVRAALRGVASTGSFSFGDFVYARQEQAMIAARPENTSLVARAEKAGVYVS